MKKTQPDIVERTTYAVLVPCCSHMGQKKVWFRHHRTLLTGLARGSWVQPLLRLPLLTNNKLKKKLVRAWVFRYTLVCSN